MKDVLIILESSLKESIVIALIIFAMMVVVELLVLKFKNKFINAISKNRVSKYWIPSFFGIIPGCIGTFAMDSLYMAGLLSFGGIIAVMISTSGDEAFLMLSMATKGLISWKTILLLMTSLFFLGILGGFVSDIIKKKTKMKVCTKCGIVNHKKEEFKFKHFLKEHVVNHILKKHLWQIFLWLFAALFFIGLLEGRINPNFSGASLFYILIVGGLVGLLPISGPNVFLLVMFSKGIIPFSVLLTNSIIQDGHGLLPIIGFSVDDAIKIKIFNFIFGIVVGILLLVFGI